MSTCAGEAEPNMSKPPLKLSIEGLDDQCGSRVWGGFQSAVPLTPEASPGIPTSPSSSPSPGAASSFNNLAPPSARSSICSPRSPTSLSISKKMRALLQGKKLLLPKKHQPSSSSTSGSSSSSPVSPFDHFSSSTSSSPRSFVESEQLNDSPPPPPSAASTAPFKNMSGMLLDLWYSRDRAADQYHLLVSPPANELNSSFSSSSSDSGVDENFDMFYQREQSFDQERQHSFVHFHDESRFDVDEEDDEFFFSGFKSFLNSDRFRVETSDSASLVSHFHRHNRLQSALKSSQRKSKARKQVRFADDGDQQQEQQSAGGGAEPTILLRCSSRRYEAEDDDQLDCAAAENNYCKKTRPRRDLSKLLMQIVQADAAELAAKQRKRSLFLRSAASRRN